MVKKIWQVLIAAGLVFALSPAVSAELRMGSGDSVETMLAAQKGKRVTVRVRSGQDFTGTVRDVNGKLVHLGAIAGKEYYDAVVPLDVIDALVIRTKE